MMTVHEIVRAFVASREAFSATELAGSLRANGYLRLAEDVLADPALTLALVNEHTSD